MNEVLNLTCVRSTGSENNDHEGEDLDDQEPSLSLRPGRVIVATRKGCKVCQHL